jgi:hypothetical protein
MKLKALPVLAAALILESCATDCPFPPSPATEVFHLQYAPADRVAQTLTDELIAERGIAPNIAADVRTNSVVVGPALRADLIRLERRIRELDVR